MAVASVVRLPLHTRAQARLSAQAHRHDSGPSSLATEEKGSGYFSGKVA